MLKWFEQIETDRPNIIYSRVRLVRNWKEYRFPSTLTDAESLEMIKRLHYGLKDLGELQGIQYNYMLLDDLDEVSRLELRERRVFPLAIGEKKTPTGLLLSEEEDKSMILNGNDHMRIQIIQSGLHLTELWQQANQMDDYIGLRFPYAFDEKYGYLTSFPTNVGTALKASVAVHLPSLSTGKKFQGLISDMGRLGANVRELYGGVYEVSNQKTLGMTEKEIIDLITKAAIQLSNQEQQIRTLSLKQHRLERTDEAYKSYGVLRYARRLAIKDAMIFLSQMMSGEVDGLLAFEQPCSFYRLMLGILPANLQAYTERPLSKSELEVARAEYIRANIPELK